MILRTLRPEGRRLVTEELATGVVARWDEDTWRPVAEDRERPVELDELDEQIAKVIRGHAPFDPAIDAALAPLLHRALRLTRREAADIGIWRFLTVVHAPHFVRHRWEYKSWATAKTRYWSPGTRHNSNAFGRLWWIAELTREGDSYDLTARALAKQSVATQTFSRTWSQHRPAVLAFVDLLENAPAEVVEHAARDLGRHLAIVPLERLDHGDLVRIIRSIARV